LNTQTGIGFSAFNIDKPQTVNFKVLFGETVPGLGAGQPHLEVYYQKADGIRELVWPATPTFTGSNNLVGTILDENGQPADDVTIIAKLGEPKCYSYNHQFRWWKVPICESP
ncbi:MAG: hypothetical protein BWK78_02080, partial [Thiotrichaceae bacterium IS1]